MPIAPNTTKLGIAAFDNALGGIYLHKPTVVCGRRKSGKFVVATQLMAKTLLVGDKVVIFTAKTPEEILRSVSSSIVNLNEAAESGQLLICPYSSMERPDAGPYATLPFPQALDELCALVRENAITYAIFDTVVPWTAIQPVEAMQEHVDTFLSTLDSLGLTSLLLLPEPASPASHSLAKALREGCPINIELASQHFGAEFTMQVTKFQGLHGSAGKLPLKFKLDFTPDVGFNSVETKAGNKDIGVIALPSGAMAGRGHEAAPAFRPFLAGGLVDFAGSNLAAVGAPPAMKAPSAPPAIPAMPAAPVTPSAQQAPSFAPFLANQPGPSFATPAAPATPAAQQAPSFAPFIANQPGPSFSDQGHSDAQAPSGSGDGVSFADVIDLPEFHHTARPAAPRERPKPPPPPPPPKAPDIQFSSVIR